MVLASISTSSHNSERISPRRQADKCVKHTKPLRYSGSPSATFSKSPWSKKPCRAFPFSESFRIFGAALMRCRSTPMN